MCFNEFYFAKLFYEIPISKYFIFSVNPKRFKKKLFAIIIRIRSIMKQMGLNL